MNPMQVWTRTIRQQWKRVPSDRIFILNLKGILLHGNNYEMSVCKKKTDIYDCKYDS